MPMFIPDHTKEQDYILGYTCDCKGLSLSEDEFCISLMPTTEDEEIKNERDN